MHSMPEDWAPTKSCRPKEPPLGSAWFAPEHPIRPNSFSYKTSKATVSAEAPKFFHTNSQNGVPIKPRSDRPSVWDDDFGKHSPGWSDLDSRVSEDAPHWFRVNHVGVHSRPKDDNGLGGEAGADGQVSALAPPWFHIKGVKTCGATVYSGDKPHRRPLKPPEQKNKYAEYPKVKKLTKDKDTAINFQWDKNFTVGFTRENVDFVLPEKLLPRGKSLQHRKIPRRPAQSAKELADRPVVEVSGGARRRRIQDVKAKHVAAREVYNKRKTVQRLKAERSVEKEKTLQLLKAEVMRLKRAR